MNMIHIINSTAIFGNLKVVIKVFQSLQRVRHQKTSASIAVKSICEKSPKTGLQRNTIDRSTADTVQSVSVAFGKDSTFKCNMPYGNSIRVNFVQILHHCAILLSESNCGKLMRQRERTNLLADEMTRIHLQMEYRLYVLQLLPHLKSLGQPSWKAAFCLVHWTPLHLPLPLLSRSV